MQAQATLERETHSRNGHETAVPVAFEGTSRELLEVNERLRRTVSMLQATLEATTDGILLVDRSGLVEFNRRFAEMWRIPDWARDTPDDRPTIDWILGQLEEPRAFLERVMELYADPEAESFDTIRLKDGRVFERTSRPRRMEGESVGRVWCFRDVTERVQRERELCASEARYRLLFESNPQPMWVFDLETLGFLAVNEAAVRHYGYTREEFATMTILDIRPSDDVARLELRMAGTAREDGRAGCWRHRRKDGSVIQVEVTAHTLDFDGRPVRLVLANDVSDLHAATRALAESESRFRQMAETLQGVFWMRDQVRDEMLYVSPAYETIFGRSCQSLYDRPGSYLEAVHPDDRARVLDARVRRQKGERTVETYRIVRPDGTQRWVRDRGFPIRNERGEVDRMTGEAEDVTESKLLEEELLQSQKMEAVGRLAGGVAHDFNNLLTAILGYGDMLAKRVAGDARSRRDVDEIRKAGRRAASLTKQLLAFSRKQVLQPKLLDINDVMNDIEPMLRRLLGEDIDLVTSPGPRVGPVKADPGQLEQVLLNLAVNSRDAMPEGGRLTIATAETCWSETQAHEHGMPAGTYAVLSVADNGCGMDADTRARIFEPFFTTKEQGKGTGLGLATVYGIVRQSDGHIAVESEPGRGTTFRVYFPRVDGEAAAARATPEPAEAGHGTETVLLVEDEDMVRDLTREVLEMHGYKVLEARDAREALQLCRRSGADVRALLTDVVMPGTNGLSLAKEARELCPGLRVLCMSGYTEHAMLREDLLACANGFLQKPFSPDHLARTLREILDAAAS